ncbi:hypothetical protein [Flammeovirga pacifica]|uniref:Uncharacterized protein n=1 Tax=Flammeovirga pacifica TaxID=915059 RepID=A0A1S1Z283_FLAPC|nr:hypothetical protein [Flammeovirga pacifica]OHX67380.1 hypothetical protein NH26_14015 [Flammeovirga pacifica]
MAISISVTSTILTKSRSGTVNVNTDLNERKGVKIDTDKSNWNTPNYAEGIEFSKVGAGSISIFIPEIADSFLELPYPADNNVSYELSTVYATMPFRAFSDGGETLDSDMFIVKAGSKDNSVSSSHINGILQGDGYRVKASKSTRLCFSAKKTANADLTVTATAYYSDGGSSSKSLFTISGSDNLIVNFAGGFDQIGLSDTNNNAVFYTISIGNDIHYIDLKEGFEQTFTFFNKFGGFSNIVCYGIYQDEFKTTKEVAVVDEGYTQIIEKFNIHTKKHRTLSTGYGVNWEVVHDFLQSEAIYTFIEDTWRKVIIDADSVKGEEQYNPGNFTFKYYDNVQA